MYKIEIFDDQFTYASSAMVDSDSVTIEQDFLAYDGFSIKTPIILCEKGYFVHVTTEDNEYIADGVVGDVKPEDKMQDITIRPLNTLFDSDVFYTPVSDCITWLATNIADTYISNSDTIQNRPITLTYTTAGQDLPLTGFNLHETVNILSVAISALKTYGVVVESRLDLVNKKFLVDIYQQTATKVLEASLDNVLTKDVTIGDSYGSTNKAVIRKVQVVDDTTTVLGQTSFYLHPDGSIDTTNNNRIIPVFYAIENLELEEDMTTAQWDAKALSRAKEILTPAKYDNEIDLVYGIDDQLAHPMDMQIGTLTSIYLDGVQYESILTGKRIKGRQVTLIFGVTRTEITKQLSMRNRETMTFESTVTAIMRTAAEKFEPKGGGGGGSVEPSTTTPAMDGIAAVGTETKYARGDHVHPADTSKADTKNPQISWDYGDASDTVTMRRSGSSGSYGVSIVRNSDSQINQLILSDGSRNWATPGDLSSYAKLASPALTGNPTAPTQTAGNSSTRIATTAFVMNALGKQVLSQQTVTLGTSSSTASGSTATITGTMTAVTGATEYVLFPRTCNYGVFTNLSRNGNTISATIRNLDGSAHTLTGSVGVIALK